MAIGRAIVRKPKVFLFDEPLSNLDAALRVDMRIELSRLHQELGTTMIYVTHDQVEAMTLGHCIAIFHGGRVEQLGPPLQLYRQPANAFVAGFLGAPRINLVQRPEAGAPAALQQLWASPGAPARPRAPRSAGLRAEDLQVAPAAQGGGIPARVELAEHLGDSSVLHLRLDGLPDLLRARTFGQPRRPGRRRQRDAATRCRPGVGVRRTRAAPGRWRSGMNAIRILGLAVLWLATGAQVAHGRWPCPTGYRLVWSDEFSVDGLPDPTKWDNDTGRNREGWYNNERQYYAAHRERNAVVRQGTLRITARRESLKDQPDWGGQPYTSARLITRGKADWTYGYFEIRARMPCGKGTWPALWLVGSGGRWPEDGELDIMEHVGSNPTRVSSALHTQARQRRLGRGRCRPSARCLPPLPRLPDALDRRRGALWHRRFCPPALPQAEGRCQRLALRQAAVPDPQRGHRR